MAQVPPRDPPRDKEIERDAAMRDPNEKKCSQHTPTRHVLCSDIGKEASCLNPIHPALFPVHTSVC